MLRLIVVLVVVVSAGQDTRASAPVRTPDSESRPLHAPEPAEGLTFAVLGDRVPGSDAGLDVLERAVETVNDLGVQFVVTTGNMVQGDTDRARWSDRVGEYRRVMRGLGVAWYPTPGPLDTAIRDAAPSEARGLYRRAFGPMTYSFDTGWLHVVVLPSGMIAGDGREPLLAWLADDIGATQAEQVFVFVHEPMWLAEHAEAWDEVHEILRADGRPTRVISGGTRYARDDGQRHNVRYCSVAMTGSYASGTHGYASSHSITLVHATRGGHRLTLLPHDATASGGVYPGADAEAVRALAESGWASVEGFVQAGPDAGDGAGFEIVLENPTPERFRFDAEVLVPAGWVLSQQSVSGTIVPGQTRRLAVRAGSPPLDHGGRPTVQVVVTARYPVSSGGEQSVIRRLDVPVRPRGAEDVSGSTPDQNGVLALNGRGAVRVELGERPWRLTAECWVKADNAAGSMALLSRFEGDRGFGLVWSRPGGVLPSGVVGTDRGLGRAVSLTPPERGRWQHVALTYDGTNAVLYLDGDEVGRSDDSGDLLHVDLPLYVGAEPNSRGDDFSRFSGLLDEVRVSSVVRYDGPFTPAQVFETDEHTLLLLHFDHDYYGAHPDDSGRGRHGWTVGEAAVERADR